MTADIFTWGILGTSLSHGATRENSYARDVSARLVMGKQSQIQHINLSVDGGTSSGAGIPNIAQMVGLKPKAILIEYSMNDCAVLSLSTSQSNTISMINTIKAGSPSTKIFLMTMNSLLGSSAPVLARSNLNTFYQLYRDLSVSQDVGLIDNTPSWAGATYTDMPDGMHPTITAHNSRTVLNIVSALAPLVV